MDRDWLARRIETEAWAYANADQTTQQIRLGRVLGFLGAASVQRRWGSETPQLGDIRD